MKTFFTIISMLFSVVVFAQESKSKNPADFIVTIKNTQGKTLSYSNNSGVKILKIGSLLFKDLNRNGIVDKYEDWRLSSETRAKDLASKLSIAQIAGLMLYSSHQSIPARPGGYFAGTYNGKPYIEGETDPSDLTDQQFKFLKEDNLRHVLLTTVKSPKDAANWNNKIQAYCESLPLGIPANNSSDPRHGTKAKAEFDAAAGGEISMWPSSLGMAATFDPQLVSKFGQIAAKEYRALGLTTALSPQVDIATEPRWLRFNGTFGESPKLSAALAEAYCRGFQSANWGSNSVNAMVKHWPGGGSGEAGRDAHYAIGKFAVYPGNNFNAHLIPFTQGAFKLKSTTKMASAIMPYYTISWNQTKTNVGNGYNKYLVSDLLRSKYNYKGVVCSDWGVISTHKVMDSFLDGKPWGLETKSLTALHYEFLMAGGDQFGGNNAVKPILEAYEMGINEHGETKMRARMEASAQRLLLNVFNVGLFENPYLIVENTSKTVGKAEYMREGFKAQLKSIVMLKNSNKLLPLTKNKTIYVPKRYIAASRNFLGMEIPASEDYPFNLEIIKKHFNVTENPETADCALVYIESPQSGIGYDKKDVENGGNGYLPISLQYNEYKAVDAREVSIAGGDVLESFTNRSYKNKTISAQNSTDALLVTNTKSKMGNKPVIVVVNASNPMVFSEIEPSADAILVGFGVQDQSIIETIAGKSEPTALLPMQMPASMKDVELQAEDVPFDMKCHKDSNGNLYDFGFGMNWKGVIKDIRTITYKK